MSSTPSVVDLGLVHGITVDQAAQALEGIVAGQSINWVWMPPWSPEKITPIGREQPRALAFNV